MSLTVVYQGVHNSQIVVRYALDGSRPTSSTALPPVSMEGECTTAHLGGGMLRLEWALDPASIAVSDTVHWRAVEGLERAVSDAASSAALDATFTLDPTYAHYTGVSNRARGTLRCAASLDVKPVGSALVGGASHDHGVSEGPVELQRTNGSFIHETTVLVTFLGERVGTTRAARSWTEDELGFVPIPAPSTRYAPTLPSEVSPAYDGWDALPLSDGNALRVVGTGHTVLPHARGPAAGVTVEDASPDKQRFTLEAPMHADTASDLWQMAEDHCRWHHDDRPHGWLAQATAASRGHTTWHTALTLSRGDWGFETPAPRHRTDGSQMADGDHDAPSVGHFRVTDGRRIAKLTPAQLELARPSTPEAAAHYDHDDVLTTFSTAPGIDGFSFVRGERHSGSGGSGEYAVFGQSSMAGPLLAPLYTPGQLRLRVVTGQTTDADGTERTSGARHAPEGGFDRTEREVVGGSRASGARTAMDSAPTGALQRYRVYVPNVASQLTLGAELKSVDADELFPQAYAGFGVATQGHVFLNACGEKIASTSTLQSHGRVLVQSDQDSMYLLSSAASVLGSSSAINVAGGGGVFIGGGVGELVDNAMPGQARAPVDVPPFAERVSSEAASIAAWWTHVDSTVAAAAIAAGVLEGKLTSSSGKLHWASLASAGSVVAGLNIANNRWGSAIGPSWAGTNIHGKAGVVVGSPAFTAIYGGTALTLASPFPALIGAVDTGVLAGRNVSVSALAGSASIVAGKEATLVGARQVTLAARTGTMGVYGKEILIGMAGDQAAAEVSKTQLTTNGVTIAAKSLVSMTSGKKVEIEAQLDGVAIRAPHKHGTVSVYGNKDLLLSGKKQLRAHSDEKALLIAGPSSADGRDGYGVVATKSDLWMGHVTAKEAPSKKGPGVKADSNAVTLMHEKSKLVLDKSQIKLSAGGVDLCLGGGKLTANRKLTVKK